MDKMMKYRHKFWELKENQPNDFKQHLERYVNSLPMFEFNSGEHDLNQNKEIWVMF